MATLLLSTAGSFVGGFLGPHGAMAGRAIGAIAGSLVDQALVGAFSPQQVVKGPRLTSVDISASTEGAAITRVIGRSRIAGQMIWATRFEEEVTTEETGGKGLGGSATSTTTYAYFGNFAVALCEGPVTRIGRIWLDGREVDQTQITVRKNLGTEAQESDSLIILKEGSEDAPAYRGTAYIVFERLPLSDYGNRMPIITAEVFRAVGNLEPLVEGVALLPGSTEFGYDPDEVVQNIGPGDYREENRHTKVGSCNFEASLDLLQAVAPNCGTISLVVTWFGDDLRCGRCTIQPKVEIANKTTLRDSVDYPWKVAGLSRSTALVVSQVNGKPAFGGSPNDESVIKAIKELRARGFKVMFYPFIMMDIPSDNALANPYSDNASAIGQAAYPWRGRITCSPAAGFAGTVDKTAEAGNQVAAFVGSAAAGDFASSSGTTVSYTGPAEWSYRRFVLHMAKLCELAGGVDLFCIGSEMVGMSTVRDGPRTYPFVTALKDITGEVRAMLPSARLGYAADWSEYHSHRPSDGSNDVFFNLDPLWADSRIDFIGIDNYLPIADWRDGTGHLDYAAQGPTTIYDRDYLKGNVEGGEYYDWYYANTADREAQSRTPISDTAHGKHWVFRQKDIRNWWLNPHHDRPAGGEEASATPWVPQSKPVIFTELGCPAVDKGANQPNVFFDPKSSESFLPYFSSGARDDAMQRAYLEATIGYWNDDMNNPSSALYAGRMMETASTCLWAWDARMSPSFPQDFQAWADAPNWELGHWISGRLGAAPAPEAISALMAQYGLSDHDVEPMGGVVDGIVIDRVISAREVLDAVAPAYFAYAVESQGLIRFRSRQGSPVEDEIGIDDLVALGRDAGELFSKRRGQESELPALVKLGYGEPVNDDREGAVDARRMSGTVASKRTLNVVIPVVMPESRARAIAEAMLHDAWAAREAVEFALPPSRIALDPGDVVRFTHGVSDLYRVSDITDGIERSARLSREAPSLYAVVAIPPRPRPTASPRAVGQPEAIFFDGALLRDSDEDWPGYTAAYLKQWGSGVAFYRSPEPSGFVLDSVLDVPARMGVLAFDFHSGPVWCWDEGNELWVDLFSGELASATELQVLGGANGIAVENAGGEWEIVQFQNAELVSAGRYKLSRLLRGQRGSEHAMRSPVRAGARVLLLDGALGQPNLTPGEVGLPFHWRVGPANRSVDHHSYADHYITMTGKGRRPLSPVHVAGLRPSGTNDIKIVWKRRTRIGGDSWEQTEVPLAEETEAYEIEILSNSGGSVKRMLKAVTPEVTYTETQQITDFGATISFPGSLVVRVFQLSATYGRSVADESTLYFPLPVEI